MMSHRWVIFGALIPALIAGCSGSLYTPAVSAVRAAKTTIRGPAGASPTFLPAGEMTTAAPVRPAVFVHSGDARGPSGELAIDLELPRTARGVQSLPENTNRVVITVTSSKLSTPIRQEISRHQFIDGRAKMLVNKLPQGEIRVDAQIFDANGAQVTMGGATATVSAGTTTPVVLNLVVKEETGAIAIRVDAKVEYHDTPEVILPGGASSAELRRPRTFKVYPPEKSTVAPSWLNTEIEVREGDLLAIATSGKVGHSKHNESSFDYYGPDGCQGCKSGVLLPSHNGLALVAILVDPAGDRAIKLKIRDGEKLRAPFKGTLCLAVNTWKDSNSAVWYRFGGAFDATIKVL
ncbi:MAG: hypothetical protein FJZ00_00165 [Candidatus Sericytochromatia bacterium]|uniref:Uncharacterized protein n=1 Tax=Candidatus Tanganyikabacteria bacterium TaxID=2961651 RepID=A0A937X062_9BACT|nr:hypothetical protein [Candidatus Tanganyikabacteria bacterium]